MVGRTERPTGYQRLFRRQHAHDGINLTDFQTFLPGHIRQDGGEPLGKHTFTGAGRAGHEYIMSVTHGLGKAAISKGFKFCNDQNTT